MAIESIIWRIIFITFALVGLLAVVGLLGMWLMHGEMMEGMFQRMMVMCSNVMTSHP